MYHHRKTGRLGKSVPRLILMSLCLLVTSKASAQYTPVGPDDVVDLSPVISGRHYQYWPGGQIHHQPLVVPYIVHGDRPWASDLIILDENTATQTDTPAHMMPPQHSGLPNAHYWGGLTVEKVPAWQLVGEVYKIDGRSMLDHAPPGVSPLFTLDAVMAACPAGQLDVADRGLREGMLLRMMRAARAARRERAHP